MKQNDRIIRRVTSATVEPNFPCYCRTSRTCEKVVGLLLKSIIGVKLSNLVVAQTVSLRTVNTI